MNQLWRRNIKKAAKAGVEVDQSARRRATSRPSTTSTSHTAERDHFTPRPLAYFQTMVDALCAEEPDRIRLYLARHEGDLVAATIWSGSARTPGTPTAPPPPRSATSAAPTPCSGR